MLAATSARGFDLGSDITRDAEEQAAEKFAQQAALHSGHVPIEHHLPPVPERTPSDSSDLSRSVSRMLSAPAQPLEPEQRSRFEPVLKHSLGNVRVHLGSEADVAARRAGAHALAVGSHVGFAAGRYSPGTYEGDRMLAHELAHVVQQTTHGPPRVRFFAGEFARRLLRLIPYAPLFEAISEREARSGLRESLRILEAMRDVAFAIAAEDVPGVKEAVKHLTNQSLFVSSGTALTLEKVVVQLVGDTLDLGLLEESRILRKTFTTSDFWFGRAGPEEREQSIFSSLVDRAIQERDLSSPVAAEAGIDRMLRVFRSMTEELGAHGGFHGSWEGLLQSLASSSLEAFEVLAQAATTELETKAGASTELKRAQDVLGRMQTTIGPAFPVDKVVKIDVTRSDFAAKPNPRHLDYFRRDAKAPWAGISAYSLTVPKYEEKQLGIRRVLDIRAEQLAALEMMFGREQDDKGQITPASKENAESIAAVTGFRLHDNESWRQLSLEKFRRAKAWLGDDGLALTATINLLRLYLKTFTIHTPSNIDDFGEEYLSKTFPRALTGQLIHDCGVYALRVAYALSLVRKELDLEFRAIVLPVHVGLIINFKNRALPVFIAHNEDLAEISKEQLDKLRDRYASRLAMRSEPGDFLAHVAAGLFVQGVDLPFRLEAVPQVPDVAAKKDRHKALWDFYLNKIVLPDVVQPTASEPQPELLYLAVLESQRMIHDTYSVPLWSKGFAWWRRHKTLVERASETHRPQTRTSTEGKLKYREEVKPHWEELWNMSQDWRDAMSRHAKLRRQVVEFMKANPTAVDPSARLTRWGQAALQWEEERAFWDYVGDPGNEKDRLEQDSEVAYKKIEARDNSELLSGETEPPWATKDVLLRPND